MKRLTIRRLMLTIAVAACLLAIYRCTYVRTHGPFIGLFVKIERTAGESGCVSIYYADGALHPRGFFLLVYRDIRRDEIPWAIGHVTGRGFILQHYRPRTWAENETWRGP